MRQSDQLELSVREFFLTARFRTAAQPYSFRSLLEIEVK